MADGDPGMDLRPRSPASGGAGAGTVAGQAFGIVDIHRWAGGWHSGHLCAGGAVFGAAPIPPLARLTAAAALNIHGIIAAENGDPDAVACQGKRLTCAMGQQGLQR